MLRVYAQEDPPEGPGRPQFTPEQITEMVGVSPQELEGEPEGYIHVNYSVDAERLAGRGDLDLPKAGTYAIIPSGEGYAIALEGVEGNVTGATIDLAAQALLDNLSGDDRILEITDFTVELL